MTETAFTPETLQKIGPELYGVHWQADLARALNCSRSQITRYLNNSRKISPHFIFELREVIQQRVDALEALLRLPVWEK